MIHDRTLTPDQRLAQAHETIRDLQAELQATNRGLMALALELEKRVDERTSELRATQEELQKTNSELMLLTLELESRVDERTAELQEAKRLTDQLNADLERRVSERTAQLQAANQELEAFSYSVSHDLRAPLRAIDGFSQILVGDYSEQLSPEAIQLLARVRHNVGQMSQLIEDLLEFSRLSREPLTKSTVLPADLARKVLRELEAEQAGRQIEVIIGDLAACQADPKLLKQVFVNLLSNALKFTRQRPVARIEVGTQAIDGEEVYFVKDNGAGFDMRYAGKLFGVFQRLHSAAQFDGTGVGLAIVQRIITRHGGRIWAEAEVDRGATFYFALQPRAS